MKEVRLLKTATVREKVPNKGYQKTIYRQYEIPAQNFQQVYYRDVTPEEIAQEKIKNMKIEVEKGIFDFENKKLEKQRESRMMGTASSILGCLFMIGMPGINILIGSFFLLAGLWTLIGNIKKISKMSKEEIQLMKTAKQWNILSDRIVEAIVANSKVTSSRVLIFIIILLAFMAYWAFK